MGKLLNDSKLIEGVKITPLKKIEDDRGMLLHMLRSDADHFEKFGEVYFSVTNPNVVKGWKLHKEMIQNFAVPVGTLKLVIFDDRDGSSTRGEINEIEISLDHYGLVTIPNGLWYSFKTISEMPSMIANCASIVHTPDESIVIDLESEKIPYRWN